MLNHFIPSKLLIPFALVARLVVAGRLLALAFLLVSAGSLQAATLLKQNFESANPWSGMSTYYTAGGGSVTATPAYGAVGTIDGYNGTTLGKTASNGVQLTADSSTATGNWTAGLRSGVQSLAITTTQGKEFITLAFSLSATSTYPIRVKIESFDNSSVRTGGLAKLIYPAAAEFYQRYALDLDTMTTDGSGTFNPADPKVQITFELDSSVNAGTSWPAASGHSLKIDNISLATPKYYVKPASLGGSDTASGLTASTALATVQKAADKFLSLNAGTNSDNIVAIMGGADYVGTNINGSMVQVAKAGTPHDWIVFKNYPGHTPVLRPVGWEGFKFTNNNDGGFANCASYVEVRGLTIRGLSSFDANGDRQIDPAYQSYVGLKQGPSNTNGITVDGRNNALKPHHFRFADNIVEFCPGGGINNLATDRVQVENNLVRNNCWWMVYAGSGINFFEILDTETGANYRMLMRDNIVYANETMVPWFPSIGQFSDGNGMILDTYSLTYTGKTIMSNNLVFNNGGSGVHILQASNVDATHNTSFMNSASPNLAYTQLDTQSTCNNIRMTNNIGVAPRNTTGTTTGSTAYLFNEPVTAVSIYNSSNIVHLKNVYAGGDTTPVTAALGANNTDLGRAYSPASLFISPSTNPAVADFRLRAGAAALNYGAAVGYRGVRDINGTTRSLTGSTDSGVYQLVGNLTYSPVVSVASGNYFGTTQNIALSSDTAGATIVYTTNGSTPAVDGFGTPTNGSLYARALPVSSNTTIKAIAWKSGLTTSPATTAIYDFTDLSTIPCSLEIWTRAADGNGQKLTDIDSVGLTTSTIHTGTRSIQGLTRTPGAYMRYIDETVSGAIDPTSTTGTPQEYRGYYVYDYALVRYGAFKPGRLDSSILSAEITIRASIGNTADGDTLVTTGANTVRYVRFLNAEDFSSAYIFARINGVTGNYRAAIYSDTGSTASVVGSPTTKLAESSLVTNPATGWTSFPLAARYTLAKSKYYWLAIWSDNASAGLYSTTTGGTVSEQAATFSATWPATAASTAVAATNNYAIYATNSPPNAAPAPNAGPNQTGASAVALPVNGTVGDDGVPVAPGAVTQKWTKISGPGTVTFGSDTRASTTATFSADGSYILRLTATDGLSTAFDEVTYDIGTGTGSDPSPPSGGVRARFSDGVGTTYPQQYLGLAGDGWASAWTASPTNMSATVLGTTPLLTGAGNYLKVTRSGGSGTGTVVGVSRQWDSAVRPTGSTGPSFTRLTFSYRIDSTTSVFASSSDIYSITINSGTGPGPGIGDGANTSITLATFGNKPTGSTSALPRREWGVYNGATNTTYSHNNFLRFPVTSNVGMASTPGTTYTFTIDIYAASAAGTTNGKTHGTYDVTVSDGTTSKTITGARFRSLGYTAGPYLAFSTQQSSTSDALAFSLDSIEMTGLPTIATTTAVTSDTNPADPGHLITYTATVTGASGTPAGTVTFYNGAIPLGSSALDGSRVATLSTSSLSSGPHDITATYASSATYLGSTSSILVQTIRSQSTTDLVSSQNPANVGASVTYTATVTGSGATPTGSVTFYDGATSLGTITLDAAGVASITTSGLGAGLRSITAVYSGNATYGGSDSAVLDQSIRPATTTTLASSANPATVGASITYTATVSRASGTPEGDVTFYDGGTPIGTAALDGSGVATFATSSLTTGTHSITAGYAATTGFQGSTSAALSQIVRAASTTTVSSSLNPASPGDSITFTATVTGASGTPGGSVTFFDGATDLGSAALNGSGVATLSTTALTSGGVRSVTAVYGGNATYGGSTSAVLDQTIRSATTTVLTSSANPANPAATVTLTATVTSAGATPSGTVTFLDGATTLGTGPLDGSGVATLVVSTLTAGPHSLTASYAQTATHLASVSSAVEQVIRYATTTILTSNANPAPLDVKVTFTATVTSTGGGTPAGTVTFKNGVATLGTGTLNGSGIATYSTSALAVRQYPITAEYAVTPTFASSTSAVLNQDVVAEETTPAGVVRARFTGGNGTAAANQYKGIAGDGWATAWTTSAASGTFAGSVVSTTPLNGAGKYLRISLGTAGASTNVVNRQWDTASRAVDAFTRLTFTYRVESPATGFDTSDDYFQITINSLAATSFGTDSSICICAFGGIGTAAAPTTNVIGSLAAREWGVFNGDGTTGGQATKFRKTNLIVQPGTTYTFTVDIYAASAAGTTGGKTHGTYDVTISDGTNTATITGSRFRAATTASGPYTSGPYLAFTSRQNSSADALASSVDSIEMTTLPTATALASSAATTNPGDPVTFTAGVSVPSGTSIPSGTVTFLDGVTSLGTGTLNASGLATFTTSALAAGSHSITASYGADTNHGASVSSALAQVIRHTTTTALASSVNPANIGDSVIFTATVASNTFTPSGIVTFLDGGTSIGTGTLNDAGVATLYTSSLTSGMHSLTATYSSNGAHLSSTSSSLPQKIRTPTETWRTLHFSPVDLTDPAKETTVWGDHADPENDGMRNLLERALGGDPWRSSSADLPVFGRTENGALTLTFLRAMSDLTYIVEGSSTLLTWDTLATNPGAAGQNVTVNDTPPFGAQRRFLRLRVKP